MPCSAQPHLLRESRGLRRAFILPHVRPAGDPHHHGERRLCPASAEALPARVLALVRPCAAGGRGGQAHVPHHSAGKDPLDPGGLRAGERRFPPHQLRHARNRLLPAELLPRGVSRRRQRDRSGQTLPSRAAHEPPEREPRGIQSHAGNGLCAQGRRAQRRIHHVFQAVRSH